MLKILGTLVGVVLVVGGLVLAYRFLSSDVPPPAAVPSSAQTNTPATEVQNTPITTQVNTKQIMTATLHTNKGAITLELLQQDAPNTVANFIKLAQSGFYDGTKFHRVIKDFMNQGGDPLTRDDSQMARWGTGGPGYTFADEIHANNRNAPGTISMANAGPNTNGSQFFLNVADNGFLDTKHTVFGKVTAGMEVMLAINNTQTDAADRPTEPVVLERITLE